MVSPSDKLISYALHRYGIYRYIVYIYVRHIVMILHMYIICISLYFYIVYIYTILCIYIYTYGTPPNDTLLVAKPRFGPQGAQAFVQDKERWRWQCAIDYSYYYYYLPSYLPSKMVTSKHHLKRDIFSVMFWWFNQKMGVWPQEMEV